jgi:hypothetical protein
VQWGLSIALALAFSSAQSSSEHWRRVYSNEDVVVEMDPWTATLTSKSSGRITFRWTWSRLKSLRRTPGVSYKSVIEITEFDCAGRRLRTVDATLFDEYGHAIDLTKIPSDHWDPVRSETIAGHVFTSACKLLGSLKK